MDSFRRTYDKFLKARKKEESRQGLQEVFHVLTKLGHNAALGRAAFRKVKGTASVNLCNSVTVFLYVDRGRPWI